MHVAIEPYLASSERVETRDIDWTEAARFGLSSDEIFMLTYFADVENQSLRYLRMLLEMKIAYQPDVAAFLAIWNYEEFFHGHALEQLLRSCGVRIEEDRREQKQRQKHLNEYIEIALLPFLSRVYREAFPAVYLTFGAIAELTTLHAYESLAARSQNPALRTLAERIARQERRHFAWYFNNAEARLARSTTAQHLTRLLLRFNWVPVGAGIHHKNEVARLFRILFYPRPKAQQLVRSIDEKLASLPGLQGLALMQGYFARAGLV
jgi:hypothetical protein